MTKDFKLLSCAFFKFSGLCICDRSVMEWKEKNNSRFHLVSLRDVIRFIVVILRYLKFAPIVLRIK